MAYSVTKIGGFGRPLLYREFLIDTTDDISSLPITGISSGSMAYCVEENSRYIFTNNKEWTILEDGGSSGAGLPEVTSADDGKVLGVVDGEWGVADAGGVFVVGITYDYDNSRTTLDKTYAEILAAAQAGNIVIAKGADTDNGYDLNEGVMSLGAADGTYYATVYQGSETTLFSADSESGTLISDFGGGGGGH